MSFTTTRITTRTIATRMWGGPTPLRAMPRMSGLPRLGLLSLLGLMSVALLVASVASPSGYAVAQTTVTPSCPAGFVFSGGTCVSAAPVPTCPAGFVFANGACAPAPQAGTGASSADTGPWAMIVPVALGVTKASELDGATLCVETGKPAEAAVTAYFEANNMAVEIVAVRSQSDLIDTYQKGACDVAVLADSVAATEAKGLSPPGGHDILPERIVAVATAAPPRIATPQPVPQAAPSQPPVRRAAPTPVRRAAPTPPPPPADLATPLQQELKRIGCLTGRVDGIWGRGSRAALQRFANQAGLRLGSEPTQQAITEASRTEAGFCQPVRAAPRQQRQQPQQQGCRAGTVLLEGECIPNGQVASFCGPGFERSGSRCVSMAGDQSGGQSCLQGDFEICEEKAQEYCEGDGSDACFNSEVNMCLREEMQCSP
jgi:outer membrane biosynthesis protein TonB